MRERLTVSARLDEISRQLSALEYSLELLDPEWEPPVKIPRLQKNRGLLVGTLSKDCSILLQQCGAFWTREMVDSVAARRRFKFKDRHDQDRFASRWRWPWAGTSVAAFSKSFSAMKQPMI